ncbi:MAG: flagellar assembly protein FliX [Pseudomonadota bacterium]
MRIQAPNKITPAAATSAKKRSTGSASFASSIESQSESTPTYQTQQAAPVTGLDSLLATQSVDPDAERRASIQTANDVLGALEQLRRGILLGAISVDRLRMLSASLGERLALTTDPKLQDIMTDIVLRARVELAKAGIYS